MKKENDKLKEELTDVKLKSMQNNLIFYNIDENEEENCPELIINFCDERLKIGNAATKIRKEKCVVFFCHHLNRIAHFFVGINRINRINTCFTTF
jgi:hypothetical protein